MKISLYALACLSLYVNHAYAIDDKIMQMIYVEKDNAHDQESDTLYFVTENHKLYCSYANAIKTDGNNKNVETKLTLREYSTNTNQYHPVEDRVVLIGQPMIIKETWAMPAVIKRKGILGRLLRPDICLIKYTTLDSNLISSEPEPFLSKSKAVNDDLYESEDEEEMISCFVIKRLAEGHRTKVTKIGFQENANKEEYLTLVSGSEWPTVKHHNISDQKYSSDDKDTYLIDIISNKHIIISRVKKSWFAGNTFTFESVETDIDSTISLDQKAQLPYLPTIFFDPTKTLDENFIEQTFKNYLVQAKTNEKTWKNSTCYISTDYAIIVFSDLKKYNVYAKDGDQLNFKGPQSTNFVDGNSSLQDKNVVITACAFDFANCTLFYATHEKKDQKEIFGEKGSKARLNKIELKFSKEKEKEI